MLLRHLILAIGTSLLTIDTVLALPGIGSSRLTKSYQRVEPDPKEPQEIPPLPLPVSNEVEANANYFLEPERIPSEDVWRYKCDASSITEVNEEVTVLQWQFKDAKRNNKSKQATALAQKIEQKRGEALKLFEDMNALEKKYKHIKVARYDGPLEPCPGDEEDMESYDSSDEPSQGEEAMESNNSYSEDDIYDEPLEPCPRAPMMSWNSCISD
ncbi:hypothetical protein FRC02_001300 [Tulasnella sp. 418]|nr:hypothetical protein FRC02_001300 [Tulasnella sp. 418]